MSCVKYSMFFNKKKFDFESRHSDSEPACACFRKKRGMNNSERFRACFSDNMNRLLSFVYLPQIHFRIDLDGRLDETRLLDALELAVRETPVLSCRYVEHPIRPYWERNPKADCRSGDVFLRLPGGRSPFSGRSGSFSELSDLRKHRPAHQGHGDSRRFHRIRFR